MGANVPVMSHASVTFAKSDPHNPSMYVGELGGYSFRLHHAAKGRRPIAWHFEVHVTGMILGSGEVELETMSEARSVATRFLATVDKSKTLVGDPGVIVGGMQQVVVGRIIGQSVRAAVEFVRRPAAEPFEPVDLDAGMPAPEPVTAEPVVVIACGAAKLDRPAVAAELYTSANFRLHLRAARALAAELGGRVLILSALHGLVDPAAELEPYDVKMGDSGSIPADVLAKQLAAIAPSSIHTLLPRAYANALRAAAGGVELVDLFAGAPGIGYQRGVSAKLLRRAVPEPAPVSVPEQLAFAI
jgi:uncharacterized protein DUF6884